MSIARNDVKALTLFAVSSLFASWAPARAQAPQSEPPGLPEFEVASIKLIPPGAPLRNGIEVFPGGRVVIYGANLKGLAATAFHLSYWQISGGDSWTAEAAYTIEAKPPEDLQRSIKDLRHTLFDIDDVRLRGMLQALLIDRFQLKFHRETKTGDVYLLERSGKALRLLPKVPAGPSQDPPPSLSSAGSIGYAGGRWGLFNTTMPQLAKFASDHILNVPVLDRTELSGAFEYRQIVPDDEPAYSGPGHQGSFVNMISAIGLKLERSKGPVEVLVIDHAEKPTSN